MLSSVLPRGVPLAVEMLQDGIVVVKIGSTTAIAAWVDRGWPTEVRAVVEAVQGIDLVVAPAISPGARDLLADSQIGWADETGGAQFFIGPVVVARDGLVSAAVAGAPAGRDAWTEATLGVVEALLTGTPATVATVQHDTKLSSGSCTRALSTLSAQDLLESDEARGPGSGRRLVDPRALLQVYADQADRLRKGPEIRVGVLWRDPVAEAEDLGAFWRRARRRWAATGPLAGAVMNPLLTHITPWEVYVEASSMTELVAAAQEADLQPADGGRLTLRNFPGSATANLSRQYGPLRCAPWPRVFADLRRAGVRGDEAAEHLADEQLATLPGKRNA